MGCQVRREAEERRAGRRGEGKKRGIRGRLLWGSCEPRPNSWGAKPWAPLPRLGRLPPASVSHPSPARELDGEERGPSPEGREGHLPCSNMSVCRKQLQQVAQPTARLFYFRGLSHLRFCGLTKSGCSFLKSIPAPPPNVFPFTASQK